MKVIAISSNPKKEDKVLTKITNAFLKGMRQERSEINLFHTRNLEVYPCRGCTSEYDFRSPGYCYCDDDMNKLYPYFKEADLWIFITPLENGFLNKGMKIILDRMEPLFSPTLNMTNGAANHHLSAGKIFLISSSANSNISDFESVLDNFSGICTLFNRDFSGSLLRPNSKKIAIAETIGKKFQELYDEAYTAGRQYAMSGNINHDTLNNISKNYFDEESFFNDLTGSKD